MYEPANPITVPPSGGCQPGCRAFEQWFQRWWKLPSLGCYNPASVIPGGGPSLHRDGRAVDVGHDFDPAAIMLVHELSDRLVANHARLGVQQILYRGFGWTEPRGWHPLTASTNPHWSHAHVEFLVDQSRTLSEHDFITTLGLPPMDLETIELLAAAIARHIHEYVVPIYKYDTGTADEVPAKVREDFNLRELSLIRKQLTGG